MFFIAPEPFKISKEDLKLQIHSDNLLNKLRKGMEQFFFLTAKTILKHTPKQKQV